MTGKHRAFFFAFLMMLALPEATGIAGGLNIDCVHPRAPHAAINVVTLPFRTTDNAELSLSARRLAYLIQMDTLFSIAPLHDVVFPPGR